MGRITAIEQGAKALSDLLRGARAKPRIALGEWIGRGPSEDVLSALAEKQNKLIPAPAMVPIPVSEQINTPLKYAQANAKKMLAAYTRPSEYLSDADRLSNQEVWKNNLAMLLQHQEGKRVANPAALDELLGTAERMLPFDRPQTLRPGPPTIEELAIQAYRQNPGAFQDLVRSGKLSRASRDFITNNAGEEGSYLVDAKDAEAKAQLLRALTEQPLALKKKLALYRGLELPNTEQGSSLFGSGFGSFSYDPGVAGEFVGGRAPSRTGILTRLKAKDQEGLRGLDISDDRLNPSGGASNDVPNELEVLLAPNQGFSIQTPRLSTNDELLLELSSDPSVMDGMRYYADGGSVFTRKANPRHTNNESPLAVLKALAGMLGSTARGAVAATGGVGGDLTRLGYLLTGNEQPGKGKTLLPDTSDMLRAMPNLPLDMRAAPYEALGSIAPITPSAAGKLAKPVGRAGAEVLARAMESESPRVGVQRVSDIKAWLASQMDPENVR